MSRTIDFGKRQELIDSLVENFPDIKSTGRVTFNQVIQIAETCPIWIREKSIERGVYDISEYINKNTAESNMVNNNAVENVVAINTIYKTTEHKLNRDHFIPVIDSNYVPFGNYKDIEKIISSGIFYPIYLTGPTGNGKSTSIEQICARKKIPLIRVNINNMSDEDQLIGTKTLENGNIQIVEGPILQAMRMGCTILIDECLSEHEKIRVGTVDNWIGVPLSEFELGVNYPIVSFNMDNGEFENDFGTIVSEKEDELYEVELDDGSTIILNSKHPFIVENNGELIQKSIDDGLTEGDMVVVM